MMDGILNSESFSMKVRDKISVLSKIPSQLYYRGDLSLLEQPLVDIVGTRKPNSYTKTYTLQLAQRLAQMGGGCNQRWCFIGVDVLAHEGAEIKR